MDEQLIQDLTDYLSDNETELKRIIPLSVKRAIRSFKKKRNYPTNYTDEKINADMENCYDCVLDLALYFLVKQGVEFENSHTENSATLNWKSESDIYFEHGVFPFIGF